MLAHSQFIILFARADHGQNGMIPTERLVQTPPSESSTKIKQNNRCNAQIAYGSFTEKVTFLLCYIAKQPDVKYLLALNICIM